MLLDSSFSTRQFASTRPVDYLRRTVRPIGVYALRGLASDGTRLLALDTVRGYVVEVDCGSDNTAVVNPLKVKDFQDAAGLALADDRLWFTQKNDVFWCSLTDFEPQHFVSLPYDANGVAVWQSTVYVTCQKAGYLMIFDRKTARQITKFPLPGVGAENITIRDEELWLCDDEERTVYCLDRATGEVQFSVLTPYDKPSALSFHPHPQTGEPILYVAYAGEEMYIRDNPNDAESPQELAVRDRTFIHPLHFCYYPDRNFALSNGYLVEMAYVEELSPLEEVTLTHLEWRIAMPATTDRQKVLSVEPVGMPFTEEIENGQHVAVFRFDRLAANEGRIFGWKALLEVRGIKYQVTPRQVEKSQPLPQELADRYLVDDDDLAMDTPMIQQAAREAVGSETNLLRKTLKIRNYVYDRMSYGIKPHIDTPDVALERGVGSCGEYVGVLLALARLNGIACRTVGRYKCPPDPDKRNVSLEPDFNHVWVEFYIPGFGWLPMESNVDDVNEGGPYPTRFFMGLPWYHAEIAKGITFEWITAADLPDDVSIGDLSLNHVRFTILEELPPPEKND
ncbi:transglutaminase family protein [Leptolyngbya sp. FACHB-711]|uniref:transglutaminase-like domain-containing protein n=1 Tax=Leptolyngbya sp. FACHB-711 TaxID=2692813 RepID=UPI001686F9D2|nr:transglutaminase family protein [Leptolyngbya sp. FACHB-711]MBD1850893.1 transglutaminase family protein [Cyanobacteria bacterium FACHB-502]MBD2027802.1 transglutaminase family protein [Leptolyngbya sp. FACHB-711]